ncbi:MAG: hydroxymethylbilane synthase, partial [Nitrospirota bacterium]
MKIRIGTRGSNLALWQASYIQNSIIERYPEIEVVIVKIKTTGDRILDAPLAKIGGKGLFVKEIEEAMLRKEIDIAVHSMKDVPIEIPDGLHIGAITEREDPRDALIIRQKTEDSSPRFAERGRGSQKSELNFELRTSNSELYNLPHGAHIGTSSLRRASQLLNTRPDLKITQLRGNLDTRLRKLNEWQFDAIIVAAAGMKRMGWEEMITEYLPLEISLPAIGQGAIGIECRVEDKVINDTIQFINHRDTNTCVKAERSFLRRLEGGCQVPIAAHARIVSQESEVRSRESGINNNSLLVIDGLVGTISGDTIIKGHIKGNPDDAERLGISLAEELLSRG